MSAPSDTPNVSEREDIMFTVKVTCYNREEVDELLNLVHAALDPLCKKSLSPCICNTCKYKHLCGDLRSLSRYLREEQILKYPHVLTKSN